MDYKSVSGKKRKEITKKNLFDEVNAGELLVNLPPADKLMSSCRTRNSGSLSTMKIHDSSDCLNNYFLTTRYITNLRLCTVFFERKTSKELFDHSIAFDSRQPSIIRAIIFNNEVVKHAVDYLVFHSGINLNPLKEFARAARGHVSDEKNQRFGVRYHKVSSHV